jgi:hypothetical protein
MTDAPSLPDLDACPSVLETAEVNNLLRKVLVVIDSDPDISRNDAATCMVDAMLARGHRPTERFDVELANRITAWIVKEWPVADLAFADAALTLLVSLTCDKTVSSVKQLLRSETRQPVRNELAALLREPKDGG